MILKDRLMGETLVLNRSLDPSFGDYIKLKDFNIPSELRIYQVDDLMPTIKEDFAVLEDMDAYHDEGMGDVKQNVLYFNDVVPFNVIYLDNSKSDKDNDDDKIDIKQSSRDMSVKPLPDLINTDVGAYAHGSNKLLETRPREGKSTNVGEVLTNLEIWKRWSFENSRQFCRGWSSIYGEQIVD
ncbi:hypothetical protein Tco_0198774 [Tanacetum coccineum]